MPKKPARQRPEPTEESWNDFLSPEQRLEAIAEILGEIAFTIVKKQHEQDQNL